MPHGKTHLRLSHPRYLTPLLGYTWGCLAHLVRPRERAKVWSETVEVKSKLHEFLLTCNLTQKLLRIPLRLRSNNELYGDGDIFVMCLILQRH